MDDLAKYPREVLWFHDSRLAANGRLRIVGLGDPDWMEPYMVNRPAGTDDYLFMHFPTPVRVWSDGAVRAFPAHTFFLWTPGHRHTFGHPERRWCHLWMHCTGPAVEQLVNASRIPLNCPIRFEDASLPARYLRPIHQELAGNPAPDFTLLEAYLAIWVRMIDRAVNPELCADRIPERVARAVNFLTAHLAQPISLEELARVAGRSVSRFSAEFHAAMGTSPIDYLLDLRLRHAVHLLRDRNLNIAEVALRSGFRDPFYFSRCFRRKYGSSPLKFRREM